MTNMSQPAYDIIGDVHGCAHTLGRLLRRMGYVEEQGVYRHHQRTAIFVGDIVDRGPRIRESLHLIKNMVDAGAAQAIMGNHEYNALGYTIELPDSDGRFLRDHSNHHNRLILETLTQMAPYPDEWRLFLDWFQQLPVFLELPGLRVVHACWDQRLIDEFKRRYGGNSVDRDFIIRSVDQESFEGRFLDRLTRGTSLPLPDGREIKSRDGHIRRVFRTKFWANQPKTYDDVVFQPDPLPQDIAKRSLQPCEREQLLCYGEQEPPVFIGHYWLHGRPKPLKDNIACLDYSAVKYGRLVAYRFDGESILSADKFVWVHVDPDE